MKGFGGKKMNSCERVKCAMHYQAVDKVPLQYYYTPVGFYEHGEKLNDLFASLPGDFEPFVRQEIPVLKSSDFDSQGKYHKIETDIWGTQREFRIFGIQGIAKKFPIEDQEDLETYQCPAAPALEGPEYDEFENMIQEKKNLGLYAQAGCGNLYEKLIALYGDENVLCDMVLDEPGLHTLADRIADYDAALVQRALKAKADGISFGDDYGTEKGLLMSPQCWRSFIKPRLKRIFQPAVDAGLDIHFHSCGKVMDILEDLKEIGVTSIWPQLPAYNMEELAARCRDLQLAVAIHTDRANTMTFGTPDDVRELVKREFETFRMMDGGSWFYVEADNGFPFENIRALVETIAMWR